MRSPLVQPDKKKGSKFTYLFTFSPQRSVTICKSTFNKSSTMNSASQPQSDMVQFYDQPDFSDMTIKFGEKEIKAHRIILCARSVYFKKALGPNSPFQVCNNCV